LQNFRKTSDTSILRCKSSTTTNRLKSSTITRAELCPPRLHAIRCFPRGSICTSLSNAVVATTRLPSGSDNTRTTYGRPVSGCLLIAPIGMLHNANRPRGNNVYVANLQNPGHILSRSLPQCPYMRWTRVRVRPLWLVLHGISPSTHGRAYPCAWLHRDRQQDHLRHAAFVFARNFIMAAITSAKILPACCVQTTNGLTDELRCKLIIKVL